MGNIEKLIREMESINRKEKEKPTLLRVASGEIGIITLISYFQGDSAGEFYKIYKRYIVTLHEKESDIDEYLKGVQKNPFLFGCASEGLYLAHEYFDTLFFAHRAFNKLLRKGFKERDLMEFAL